MPDTMIFDTLIYAKKLKSAGFTEEQAEIQAEALASIVDEKLAAKRDLKELETNLRRDMKEIEANLKHDMKELEVSLKRDMKELETNLKRDMKELETNLKRDMKELEIRLKHDLTLRLGGMLAASIAIIAGIMKLLS